MDAIGTARCGFGRDVFLLACGLLLAGVAVGRGAPAVTEAQLLEDWAIQARLRYGGAGAETTLAPADDAAGGCDGIINGRWGFHTANEANPWWQVDLGRDVTLSHVVVYNRADACTDRIAPLQIMLRDDADDSFRAVYRHDGAAFLGHPDGKPLRVDLKGQRARVVRLRLPVTSYFHLDEVQVFGLADPSENLALGCPALQSSLSQWSAPTVRPGEDGVDWAAVLAETLRRGQALARALEERGVVTQRFTAALNQLAAEPGRERLPPARERYLQARRVIRELALANPLLDFESLLFVTRAPPQFPHLCDQYYGWWSRAGGGVYTLSGFRGGDARVRCLSDGFPAGSFLRPDLHWDAGKLVVAFCRFHPEVANLPDKMTKTNLPEDAFYQLYEIDLASGAARRLTRGRYDDVDARYLPDDDLVFLSTRKGVFIQSIAENTVRTLGGDLPDSYVRCGGGHHRPVPVFTLHRMGGDGRGLRPISAFETFEYTPSVAADGRLLYCRWDYIDRFNGHFFSLWSCNPSGTNAQLVYGNYTKRPQATMEPCAIPGSRKILFTASAHHSITGGSLCLLDRRRGLERADPLERVTPDVPFPETEKNVGHFYLNPWPLSEDFYLVAWSTSKLPAHTRLREEDNPRNAQGLYLCDRFGNLDLLYRDTELSSASPIPLRTRPRPPTVPATAAAETVTTGELVIQDVYAGLPDVPRGTVAELRLVGVLPKVQPEMNRPSLGVSREETGKFILGRVPVEPDGSARVRVPAGLALFLQALDPQGRALQTMRSLAYVMPGQALGCVGCHEPRDQAPAPAAARALQQPPERLRPACPGGSPLRFDRLVQPVLDRHCGRCHGAGTDRKGRERLDLRPEQAHGALLAYGDGDLRKLVFERDRSMPGQSPSLQARLVQFLQTDKRHRALDIGVPDWRRLYAWMDTYGHTQGAFSSQQERQLVAWMATYGHLYGD